jgi:aminoglycoside phosphotransferase (APT) family kinase protein
MEEDSIGEHNHCFRCEGVIDGEEAEFYIKLYRSPEINLPIERDLLPKLSGCGIPVPKVLFAHHDDAGYLGLAPVNGVTLWDLIDPRRAPYQRERVLEHLAKYGAILGKVHSLPIATTQLTRRALYALSEEERAYLASEPDLIEWLEANTLEEKVEVLAHGDFHTAHVYFSDSEVSGVIDWESAGWGWREFDLAWILRARQVFLNTPEERQAILDGYARHGTWDDAALRCCEVLVYLHYAFWTRRSGSGYEAFAIRRARSICGLEN